MGGHNQATGGWPNATNAYGELDHKFTPEGQQLHAKTTAKRIKKPKDIYALKN